MKHRIIFWAIVFSTFGACSHPKPPDRLKQVMALQEMSELATAEYVVSKIIKANDDDTWYKVGDRKILLKSRASVVAGVDFAAIDSQSVHIEGNTIELTLPRAKLLYINMKPEDVRTVYEDISLFRTRFTQKEKDQLAAQAQKQIRESIPEMGILTTAETNAQVFLSQFLKNLGFETIRIHFREPKQTLG